MFHVKTSRAAEDYLKAIYEITRDGKRASTNEIAERMDVTPASATGMIQKMANNKPPLLDYRKHQGVLLTPEGEDVALEIIRHHRLLELFLHVTLGYSWDEVHPEADRLEHVISEEFEERIARALGDPAYDPHGDPIPTRDFRLPEQSLMKLSNMRPGQQGVVVRVENTQVEFLRYLHEIGLVPQAEVKILHYSPFDENLEIEITGSAGSVVLGSGVTGQVYVRGI